MDEKTDNSVCDNKEGEELGGVEVEELGGEILEEVEERGKHVDLTW